MLRARIRNKLRARFIGQGCCSRHRFGRGFRDGLEDLLSNFSLKSRGHISQVRITFLPTAFLTLLTELSTGTLRPFGNSRLVTVRTFGKGMRPITTVTLVILSEMTISRGRYIIK